ncbi:MAG: 5-formyltetrahydrofolate cyclo-ligase [Cyanophyceae cyanobacterium]
MTGTNLSVLGEEKRQLRRRFLAQRQGMAPEVWRDRSGAIGNRLRGLEVLERATVILAYGSHRQEPDLLPLMGSPWGQTKVWGLPRCEGTRLIWHQWRAGEPLTSGAFGIREPLPDAPLMDRDRVGAMLVPLVAGDRAGYRLGYGGGFYDRLLADPAWQRPPAIGLAFDFALVDHLPREPWDRPLQGLVTETQTLWFDSRV